MNIGIDMDDTICRTTEIIDKYMEEYASKNNLNILDVVNDDIVKHTFFEEYLREAFINAEIKRGVKDSIRRLRNKGNKIFIITARSNTFIDSLTDCEDVTYKWLKDHGIEVDGACFKSYGIGKAKACKDNNIDIMVDDDPYNYHKLVGEGVTCILFDDREKYDLRDNYATSWKEVEELISKIRG